MKRTSQTHPRQKQTRLLSKTHSQMFFDLDFRSYFEKKNHGQKHFLIAKTARRKKGTKFVAWWLHWGHQLQIYWATYIPPAVRINLGYARASAWASWGISCKPVRDIVRCNIQRRKSKHTKKNIIIGKKFEIHSYSSTGRDATWSHTQPVSCRWSAAWLCVTSQKGTAYNAVQNLQTPTRLGYFKNSEQICN